MSSTVARSDPVNILEPLCLKDVRLLIENDYLPLEAGFATNADGMFHVAASTYMKGCTGAMLDWWFGFVHKTDTYKLWQ